MDPAAFPNTSPAAVHADTDSQTITTARRQGLVEIRQHQTRKPSAFVARFADIFVLDVKMVVALIRDGPSMGCVNFLRKKTRNEI